MADLARAVNIAGLRRIAQSRLPRAIVGFCDGGPEDETTLRDNCAAFQRVRLLPKVLVNVSKVDTKASIFGREAALPLAVAATGGSRAGRHGPGVLPAARA